MNDLVLFTGGFLRQKLVKINKQKGEKSRTTIFALSKGKQASFRCTEITIYFEAQDGGFKVFSSNLKVITI